MLFLYKEMKIVLLVTNDVCEISKKKTILSFLEFDATHIHTYYV